MKNEIADIKTVEVLSAAVEAQDYKKGWSDENTPAVVDYYTAARRTQTNKKIVAYLAIATGLSIPSIRGKLVTLKVYDTETETAADKKEAPAKRPHKQETVDAIRVLLEAATGTPIAKDALDSLVKANAAALTVISDCLVRLSDKRDADQQAAAK